MRRMFVVFVLSLLLPAGVLAQGAGPFARLEGQWSGNGTIDMQDGRREALRCRATYDVLEAGRGLQLSIRCASESFNFNLQSSAKVAGGRVSGIWSESTLNAGGDLSGRAEGDRISVIASGQTFSADLNLTTHGDRQAVVIKSRDPQSQVVGATMNLRR
ncbi:MAG TPA: hypothetical protein VI251_10660 [Pseudolabrys sp.]|jgi:hypothetical protein